MLNSLRDIIFDDIVCPRCLARLKNWRDAPQSFRCQVCNFPVPLAYLNEAKITPPIFIQLLGLTASGKTTFLDMLRLHLYDMSKLWPHSFAQPITQLDFEHRIILQTQRAQGVLAPSTATRNRDQNEVYIMQLHDMDRWNSHFLVLMDFSGEQFDKQLIPVEEIPFLCHTPVAIMLLSLHDMERERRRADELLGSYIHTLESHHVKFSRARRQLIIVFNKADLISNLPPKVSDYLQNDQTYALLSNNQPVPGMVGEGLQAYIDRMEAISHDLASWVWHKVRGGQSILAMLKKKNIDVHFTIMSATGHELSSGNALEPSPQRVLDPFFWVMESYVRSTARNGLF